MTRVEQSWAADSALVAVAGESVRTPRVQMVKVKIWR